MPVWNADDEVSPPLRPSECPMCGEGWPESQEARWVEYERIKRTFSALRKVAEWAERYDGDIAGAITDVLDGDLTGWE